MTAVSVRALTKSYGMIAAVRDVSFEIKAGEIHGLLGPNGAGKTTALECVLGLRRPDSGSVQVDGYEVGRNPRVVRARMGAVLQSTALQDHITPREALRLFAALHRQPRARAEALLQEFALEDKAGAAFATLSGGQRQRLALALAFVHAPRVAVLDEPTAGLDPAARRDLHDRIVALRNSGCAILLSTHDMAEAERLCDQLCLLSSGQVIAAGSPASLIQQAGALTTIRLRTRRPLARDAFAGVPDLAGCVLGEAETLTFETRDPTPTLAALTQRLAALGASIEELQVVRPTLEDAFLRLTGRHTAPVSTLP